MPGSCHRLDQAADRVILVRDDDVARIGLRQQLAKRIVSEARRAGIGIDATEAMAHGIVGRFEQCALGILYADRITRTVIPEFRQALE